MPLGLCMHAAGVAQRKPSSSVSTKFYSTSSPVSTGIGDRLVAGIASPDATSQQDRLSTASLLGR